MSVTEAATTPLLVGLFLVAITLVILAFGGTGGDDDNDDAGTA